VEKIDLIQEIIKKNMSLEEEIVKNKDLLDEDDLIILRKYGVKI
jgi:hypothetical protein